MNSTPNVLVVEDDADTRANLCDILQLDDYRVLVASTAAEACEQLQAHSGIGIMLLDRNLPDGLADELLPSFRALSPATDVIIITGFADLDSTIAALKNGAGDYILKPINPDALRSSIRKIVERRCMEHEFHQETEFANRILSTAEAIVLVLDLEGRIVRYNPYFARTTGRELSEVVGKDWFEIFLPEGDRDQLRDVFRGTATGIETRGVLNAVLTREGLSRQIRWSNTTLKNEAGETTSVLAIGLDVTDLIEAQQRAVQSERLATIGQTMAALAHESRNALQRMQASIDLLRLELEGNRQALADLNSIHRAAADLNTLQEEVRAFAAPIQLKLETIPVSEVWRQAWAHLKHSTNGRNVAFKDTSASDAILSVDTLRMEQVFRNLFENSLAACTDPVAIQVCCEDVADGVEISVCDNGPGLAPEQRQKVFDAFYTTKDSGTGLGMAIVRRIVEAHNGYISVDDKYPSGAKFVISMPRQTA